MPRYRVTVTLTAIIEVDHIVQAESDALRHATNRLCELGLGVHVGKLYPEPFCLMLIDDGYDPSVRSFETEAQRDATLRTLARDDGVGHLD